MIRCFRASASFTHFSASPNSATASSIGSTRAGAPPCRGPEPAQVLLRLLVVDVDELAELPLAAEDGERRLQVGHVAAGVDLELAVGRRQAGLEHLVDQEPPHLLERNVPDELLDVDAAVT